MATLSELKACENCKERKIRCDKLRPVCGHCRRSGRSCITLKVRLSWPRAKDGRRLIIGPTPVIGRGRSADRPHFVNVTSRHIQQYIGLSEDAYEATELSVKDDIRSLESILRNPPVLRNRLGNLMEGSQTLSYFYSVVSGTLPSIPGLGHEFRDLLLRMALRDDGPSSQAVLFSVLSLTTLHQHQTWDGDAAIFKGQSLRALAESANRGNLTLETILQHMAAAIVLCRIEICLSSEASTLWCLFVCGVNTLLQEAKHNQMTALVLGSEDSRLLYSHVHYHTTMAGFSLRHWIRPGSLDRAQKTEFKGREIGFKCRQKPTMPELVVCISEEWQLLDTVLYGLITVHGQYSSEEHQAALDELEQRIANSYSRLTVELHTMSQSHPKRLPDADFGEVARRRCIVAASWIYLLRTGRRLHGPSEVISSLLRDAFDSNTTSLKYMASCNLPWPIFIIGAEASSESHRLTLLDWIRHVGDNGVYRTTKAKYFPYKTACELLQAAWAMEDLHAVANDGGRYLDYERKLHMLFTASEVLPALA